MPQQKTKIAPSILSADFAKLGEEIKNITDSGADYVHVDVMDGHFVPNLTIGPEVIKWLRPHSKLPFDVHLMIEKPDQFIKSYADAGADIITVHLEASTHLHRTVQLIKSFNKKAGVSIVPSTPPESLEYILPNIDLVLIMSVNPGFGGQSFIESSIEKLNKLRKMIDKTGKNIDLQVDGGVNKDNAERIIKAGADVLVAGSAIFKGKAQEYAANITALRF